MHLPNIRFQETRSNSMQQSCSRKYV